MNKDKIVSLIKASKSLVNSFNPKIPLEVQCQKNNLFQYLKITDKQLGVFPTINKKAIGIRNLYQNPGLRLTVYYLEKGNVMKLHDHNEMQVVSKLLKGMMQVKMYKIINNQQQSYEKKVKIYDSSQVFMIDGNKGFNLHEFRALESTFFLDIIFPDYSKENECTFYQQKGYRSENQVILEKTDYEQLQFEDI